MAQLPLPVRGVLLLGLLGAAPGADPLALDNDRAALITAKQAATDAERRAADLQRAAAQATDQATAARAEAAALALKVAAAADDIRAARARVAIIARLQDDQRRRLAERRQPLVHLLAALQTLARRPAALAVAQPGSVRDLVHVRLLLADAMPVVAARTAGLRAELDRSRQLRHDAEFAARSLSDSRALLATRRVALARIEQSATIRAQRLAEQAAEEAQRALGLGEEARDLADQIRTTQTAGEVRAHLLRLAAPMPRPGPDEPVPVHDGPPRYRLPAEGTVATGFGAVSEAGVRARGLSVVTAADAPAVAPAAGFVLFARPFRSYGGVVIVGHGGGWTTTVTGLATIAVRPGERVAQGGLLGRAGADKPQLTTELRRGQRPIDVVAVAQAD